MDRSRQWNRRARHGSVRGLQPSRGTLEVGLHAGAGVAGHPRARDDRHCGARGHPGDAGHAPRGVARRA